MVAIPSIVSPSKNVTFPVAEEGLTVAVNVAVWPSCADDKGELTNVVTEVGAAVRETSSKNASVVPPAPVDESTRISGCPAAALFAPLL